ncbi:hypothetical protein [Salipaludibacillus daqingensis]|uniref:hypothetical protein n=1 Tax=Salipaludibacillus daqingensis TaxID=3041001 RepID=UPI002474D854|nr:hypothetical protein [Salipaludibacillus daqingensis]
MNTQEENTVIDFDKVIHSYSQIMKGELGEVYENEHIPEKKLMNAIKSYGQGIAPNNVIALCDTTTFKSGKEGYLITRAGFYYKEILSAPLAINFSELVKVEKVEKRIPRKNKPDKIELQLEIFENDQTFMMGINPNYIHGENLYEFLMEVIEMKSKGNVDETDKIVILEDMPDKVKLSYLKIIILSVLDEEREMDGASLSEIQTLMAQLHFDVNLRSEIRSFIGGLNEKKETVTSLVDTMGANVPSGSEEALEISLVKDLLRVNRVKFGPCSYREFSNLSPLLSLFKIEDKQVEVIEQGIVNDEKIMRGEVKDNQIIENAKDLSAKASAVGVPIAAIYMSGSVAGLSAAGLTSGLAALGLGGVLGLSSMVTGIGVLLVAGVGVYKGVKWLTGGSERSKTQKREIIIQGIIRNNQKTINNLAEDVNHFATLVVDVALEAEFNKKKLDKLGRELSIFSQAIKKLSEKGVNLEEVLHGEESNPDEQISRGESLVSSTTSTKKDWRSVTRFIR